MQRASTQTTILIAVMIKMATEWSVVGEQLRRHTLVSKVLPADVFFGENLDGKLLSCALMPR